MVYLFLLLVVIGLSIVYLVIRYYFEKKNNEAIARAGFGLEQGIEVKFYKLISDTHYSKSLPQIHCRLFFNADMFLIVEKKFGFLELNYFNIFPLILKLNGEAKIAKHTNAQYAKIVEISPRAFKIKTRRWRMGSQLSIDYTVRLKHASEADRIEKILNVSKGLIVKKAVRDRTIDPVNTSN